MNEHADIVAAKSRRVVDILASGRCVNNPVPFDAAIDERRVARTPDARKNAADHAARLCAGCPVQGICLAAAVLSGERNGVRGGLPAWRLRQLAASARNGTLSPLRAELNVKATLSSNALPAAITQQAAA